MSSTHKRKRSLENTSVDISKMKIAMFQLKCALGELEGIEETESEITAIVEHVVKLDQILSKAQLPKMSFSTLNDENLRRLGICRGILSFEPETLIELRKKVDTTQYAEKLKDQLLEIYDRVNMDYEAGSRMILDAVLMSAGRISCKLEPNWEFAIFPEMRINGGVQLAHAGYEIVLTGSIDYAVIRYKNEMQNKDQLLHLGGGYREHDVFALSDGHLFLVEAKRQQVDGVGLGAYIPEAVGQAIALAVKNKQQIIHFCLSNGQTWLFFVLRSEEPLDKEGKEGNRWAFFQSAPRELSKVLLGSSAGSVQLCEHLALVLEWLRPSTTSLCRYGVARPV